MNWTQNFISTGGEGGSRTRVEAFAPHPISSRRRYGHFGTSPIELNHATLRFFKVRYSQTRR